MKSTYSNLAQSKFFNPAFNSAIFDGPIRIYFSQIHESLALKIYFHIQEKSANFLVEAKKFSEQTGKNILVMLYPSNESFSMSFDNEKSFISFDQLDGDPLIGINGPFEDEKMSEVLNAISATLSQWKIKPTLDAAFA